MRRPRPRRDQSEKNAYKGGLSGTVGTHESYEFAGSHCEIDGFEDWFGRIGETDTVSFDCWVIRSRGSIEDDSHYRVGEPSRAPSRGSGARFVRKKRENVHTRRSDQHRVLELSRARAVFGGGGPSVGPDTPYIGRSLGDHRLDRERHAEA